MSAICGLRDYWNEEVQTGLEAGLEAENKARTWKQGRRRIERLRSQTTTHDQSIEGAIEPQALGGAEMDRS